MMGRGTRLLHLPFGRSHKKVSMAKQPLAMPPLNQQHSHVLMKWKSQARKGGPITHTGEATDIFPNLNPDSCFTDTLSSAEGRNPEGQPLANQGEGEPASDGEGDAAALMQRTKKRKKKFPEPAPRPAGSTASFFPGEHYSPRGVHHGQGGEVANDRSSPRPSPERRSFVKRVRKKGRRRKKQPQKRPARLLDNHLQCGGNRSLHCQTMRRSSAGKDITKN